VGPYASVTFHILYTPSSLGQTETGTVMLSHPEVSAQAGVAHQYCQVTGCGIHDLYRHALTPGGEGASTHQSCRPHRDYESARTGG
jgi:hypothetical protein